MRSAGIRLEEQNNHWVARIEASFETPGVAEQAYGLAKLCDEMETLLHSGDEDGEEFVF